MNFRNVFEALAEYVYGLVVGQFGKDNAARFYPLIGAIFLFLLFGNLIGLVPGFVTPNDTLKTNLAISVTVFFLTHYYGAKEHGPAYFKHFLGPVWYLVPLMLPIEIISHVARPFSLAFRLMGNMVADHKVIAAFFSLVPIIVPLPFYFLGLFICFVQALVFCMLSMVYISMAIAHEEH
ncbi:MAG: F0F1 ATP synthase subunit A [Myxococcales bacterium]|nr:F0F1 ATP synthase subunit A [Myxococcales bacterium]